jgi:GT2 family glycosyltransferase
VSRSSPVFSVIVPTYNNDAALAQCLGSWQRQTDGQSVEVIVIEDGCTDGTADLLRRVSECGWGQRHLRWYHEHDIHEVRCTNRGFSESRGQLLLTWHDDMFVRVPWLLIELGRTFDAYPEIGLVGLSRGLNCFPVREAIQAWEDLYDWRRLPSTIGTGVRNWFDLTEVDMVVRPWVVRRACLDRVGMLDEAFAPNEWDEADLCFRIREGGWKVAAHGYERLGAYVHLGSTTLGVPSEAYKARVLRHGLLFHQRWDEVIERTHSRERSTWVRRATARGGVQTALQMLHRGLGRLAAPRHLIPPGALRAVRTRGA